MLDRMATRRRFAGPVDNTPAPDRARVRWQAREASSGWRMILDDLRAQVKAGTITKAMARDGVPQRWMRKFFR